MPRTHVLHATQSVDHAAFFHLFSRVGLVVALLLFSASHAHAGSNSEAAPEEASLPVVMPQAPLTIAARCDAGVIVFEVQNNTSRWSSRGYIRVTDAQTGNVLRERQLVLGERQKASFRVVAADGYGDNYRVLVQMPEGNMTYVKSFSGRCQ